MQGSTQGLAETGGFRSPTPGERLQVRRAGQGPGPLEIDWGLDTGTPRTVDLGPDALVLECMRCQMFGTPSSEKSILFVFFSRSPYPTRFPVLHQGCDLATRRTGWTQPPWTETKCRVKPPFPLEIPATALRGPTSGTVWQKARPRSSKTRPWAWKARPLTAVISFA